MNNLPPSLQVRARAELERRRRTKLSTQPEVALHKGLGSDWRIWLTTLFPETFNKPFAPFHDKFWSWIWALEPGVRPSPLICVWSRKFGKSSNAEAACVAVGALQKRSYGWYVSGIADQANDHVGNIGNMLESEPVARYYPALADRQVGAYGHSRGWRRNRLWTRSGFVVDALGLDAARRGAKLKDKRPDFIIFDDIDDDQDTLATVTKKIKRLQRSVIPSGAQDVAILGVQNLVHPGSIFSRFVDGRADFLTGREVDGPVRMVEEFEYAQEGTKFLIKGGQPNWPEGWDLEAAQAEMNDMGPTAFLAECQHEVEAPPGGLFSHLDFGEMRCKWEDVPDLVRITVWVDPAVTDTDESDAHGIQADGIASDGTIYRLWSWEDRTSPEDSLRRAILKCVELGGESVGVETDQGGDTWQSTYKLVVSQLVKEKLITASQAPKFKSAKAGAGHGSKVHRASLMLADYERGKFRHVIGTHSILEKALKRFPRTKPFDLVDASYWSWNDLSKKSSVPLVSPFGVGGTSTWK